MPIPAIVSAALIGASTATSAIAKSRQAKAIKEEGRRNKELAYADASRLMETTREEAGILKRDIRSFMGAQTTRYGASGVEVRGKDIARIKEGFSRAADVEIGVEGKSENAVEYIQNITARNRGNGERILKETEQKLSDIDTVTRVLMDTATRGSEDVRRLMRKGRSEASRLRQMGQNYQATAYGQASAAMAEMGSTLLTGFYNIYDTGIFQDIS